MGNIIKILKNRKNEMCNHDESKEYPEESKCCSECCLGRNKKNNSTNNFLLYEPIITHNELNNDNIYEE